MVLPHMGKNNMNQHIVAVCLLHMLYNFKGTTFISPTAMVGKYGVFIKETDDSFRRYFVEGSRNVPAHNDVNRVICAGRAESVCVSSSFCYFEV